MKSNGSRWGVKGSNEISEGLSGIYRYEENLDLSSATLKADNRLSYVGLSGGFGSITLGRVFSASYNHVGVLTDYGVASTNAASTVRTSNTVSYSASTGPVSFQVDAKMKSGNTRSVDAAELGLSFDTGAATVGLAFRDENTKGDKTKQSAIGFSIPVGGLTLYSSWTESKVTTFATPDREEETRKTNPEVKAQPAKPAVCKIERYENAAFPMVTETDADGEEMTMPDTTAEPIQNPNTRVPYKIVSTEYRLAKLQDWDIDTATGKVTEAMSYKCAESSVANGINGVVVRTFMSGSLAVQAMPESVDVVFKTVKGDAEKTMKYRHMHAGVSGPLGDTGMSFAVNVANHPDSKDGNGENPWNFNVSKSLGGGASLAFEYINNDSDLEGEENQALVQLKVDF